MTEVIFTYRPFDWSAIASVNSVTRNETKSPFDHVSMKHAGFVYESVVKKGVHQISWDEWTEGREGTYLFVYQLPSDAVDWFAFERLKGKGYDTMAILYHLLDKEEKLKNKPNDKIYCSELMAHMLKLPNPWEWTPAMVERELREYNSYIIDL